ncbi:flagellar biosynthetic protein FliO [Microvirga rosea]|uniref:flagellar biosynthetic protein FliO n=1 Tax=Microvirga rosea TaxID=2715425 RepID=UPI001D0B229A|nr:flagellar biosynthetic protein FliO [Microvirga rosea]MCB8822603.1 flagellar biosynthetic protein FliO [Microvirga rosea]
MSSLLGIEASRAAQYVIAFAIILVLVALFGLVLRKLTGGRLMIPGHDRGRGRQPRLGVVDIYDLDRQRQLVLLRRDNVEHLLLIGGLNDVVIETNIVRVAGARIPAPTNEAGPERFEPSLDQAPRPQVEATGGRPSIETQLAAQLGAFIRRPSEESDADQELAPVASASMPTPARTEPVLKPDHVTVTASPSLEPLRPEPQPSSFLRAPATPPAPPPVRPEPPRADIRPVPPTPFQSRPTPTPPSPPTPPVSASEVVRPPQPAPAEAKTPDAAILSDMAKQLEEALKRPAQPAAPPQAVQAAPAAPAFHEDLSDRFDEGRDDDVTEADLDEDELLVPPSDSRNEPEPVVEKPEPPRPAPEPVRPAAAAPQPVAPPTQPASPNPAPAPAPAPGPAPIPPAAQPQAAPNPKVSDPFSVEEIEAEFARLLGRPRDPANKA